MNFLSGNQKRSSLLLVENQGDILRKHTFNVIQMIGGMLIHSNVAERVGINNKNIAVHNLLIPFLLGVLRNTQQSCEAELLRGK